MGVKAFMVLRFDVGDFLKCVQLNGVIRSDAVSDFSLSFYTETQEFD